MTSHFMIPKAPATLMRFFFQSIRFRLNEKRFLFSTLSPIVHTIENADGSDCIWRIFSLPFSKASVHTRNGALSKRSSFETVYEAFSAFSGGIVWMIDENASNMEYPFCIGNRTVSNSFWN